MKQRSGWQWDGMLAFAAITGTVSPVPGPTETVIVPIPIPIPVPTLGGPPDHPLGLGD